MISSIQTFADATPPQQQTMTLMADLGGGDYPIIISLGSPQSILPAGQYVLANGEDYFSNGQGHVCSYISQSQINLATATFITAIPPQNVDDGQCNGGGLLPAGNYVLSNGTAYFSNGQGHVCYFGTQLNSSDLIAANYITVLPSQNTVDGECGGGPDQPFSQSIPVSQSSVAQNQIATTLQMKTRTAVTYDFNGDGTSDLLWYDNQTGQVTIWPSGVVANAYSPGVVDPASGWVIAGVGDLDGDGKADILWYNTQSGSLLSWNGADSSKQTSFNGVDPKAGWMVSAVADFDGDGKADILWYNTQSGQLVIWSGGNSNKSSYPGLIASTSGWIISGVGDFDGDGKADILWYNTSSGEISIWSGGQPIGIAGNGDIVDPSSGWLIAQVGDFDRDGKSDILWYNTLTGQTSIWSGGNAIGAPSPGSVDPNSGWQVAQVGNFYGQGASDILWYNSQSGQTSVWPSANAAAARPLSSVDPAAGWALMGASANAVSPGLLSLMQSISGPNTDTNYIVSSAQGMGYTVNFVGTPNVAPYSLYVTDPSTQNTLVSMGAQAILKFPANSSNGKQAQVCGIFNDRVNPLAANGVLTDPSGNPQVAPYSSNGKININLNSLPGGASGILAKSIIQAVTAMNADTAGTGAPTFVTDGSGGANLGTYCANSLPSSVYAHAISYGANGVLNGTVSVPGWFSASNGAGGNGAKIEFNCGDTDGGSFLSANSAEVDYHELGHVLGLAHQMDATDNPDDPMDPTVIILGLPIEHLTLDEKKLITKMYSSTTYTYTTTNSGCDPALDLSVAASSCNLTQANCGSATLDLVNCQCLNASACICTDDTCSNCPTAIAAPPTSVSPGGDGQCNNTCATNWTQNPYPDCSCVSPVTTTYGGTTTTTCSDQNGNVIPCSNAGSGGGSGAPVDPSLPYCSDLNEFGDDSDGTPCQGNCFVAGTKVETPEGEIAIEDIQVGQEVYSYDGLTGKTVLGRVEDTLVHKRKTYGSLALDDGTTFGVTAIHPFYLPRQEIYKAAGELRPGDVLWSGLGNDGHEVMLKDVDFSDHTKRVDVYNFTVTHYHNYYVNKVLVHNY